MKKYLLFIPFLCIMACSSPSKKESEKKQEKSHEQVAVTNYDGEYTGTIPAASGKGIKLNLTINKDKTFTLISDYIGEKDGIFTEQGEYSVSDDIITLENKQGPPKYFKIKSNKLIMLNTEKKEIKGDLEKMYILDKVPQLK